jgi:hypothetical protein
MSKVNARIQLQMPPPSNPNRASPEVRAASSRKRVESRRAIENADPLLPKNKRRKLSAKDDLEDKQARQDTVSTYPSLLTRRPSSSVDIEEVGNDDESVATAVSTIHSIDEVAAPGVLELDVSDSSDGGDSEKPAVIDVDVDEPEESAESELSGPITMLCHYQPKCIHSTTLEGLELTYLCLFQAHARC